MPEAMKGHPRPYDKLYPRGRRSRAFKAESCVRESG